MEMTRAYSCPCCGAKNQMSEEEGSFDICKVCGWEDDGLRDYPDNVNGITLNEAKMRWERKLKANV